MCLCLIGNPVQYNTASRQSRQWGKPSHAEQQSCRAVPFTDPDLGALSRYWNSCDAKLGTPLTRECWHLLIAMLSVTGSCMGGQQQQAVARGVSEELSNGASVPGCIRCCGRPRHAHASRRHPPPDSGRHH